MKAVVYEKPREFGVTEIGKPKIEDNQVLLKVELCGICRTDMHIHNGEFISRFPLTPGHEFTGYVSEVGKNVEGFAVGDLSLIHILPIPAEHSHQEILTHRRSVSKSWKVSLLF